MACPSVRFLSFVKYSAEDLDRRNVVDVPDGQGLLQMGMVVDASEEGVLVDFFCKGQPPRLVQYGRLLHCVGYFTAEIEGAAKVQVLLRISKDVPFSWITAKLLDADTNLNPPRLVQVELDLEGTVVKEIVHSSQIRNAPAEGTGIVGNNYFGTGSWAISNKYASSVFDGSLLWKMCERELGAIRPLRIRNGYVEYLVCAAPRQSLNLEFCLDRALRRMELSLEKGLVWSGRFFTQAPVPMLHDDDLTSVHVPFLPFLPAHLLGEIFQFLDSIDRFRQRRVCTLWDCVLSMDSLFLDVWVCPKYLYDCQFKWPVSETLHAVVLALTNLVTESTKWMIIEGSGDNWPPHSIDQHIEEPLRLIADVARYFKLPCGGKLNCVISQYRWSPGGFFQHGVEELAALCKNVATVCDYLVWKDCTYEDCLCVSGLLQIRRGFIKPASATLRADLWEILDSNVPETNLEEISQWLAQQTVIFNVFIALDEFQIPDPRLASQSAMNRRDELLELMQRDIWMPELDVRRLTRLTLWALSDKPATVPLGNKRPLDESGEEEGPSSICDSSHKENEDEN